MDAVECQEPCPKVRPRELIIQGPDTAGDFEALCSKRAENKPHDTAGCHTQRWSHVERRACKTERTERLAHVQQQHGELCTGTTMQRQSAGKVAPGLKLLTRRRLRTHLLQDIT
jgi:hypothetical protein